MSDEPRIRPTIILPPGAVSKRDIKKLCNNGLCVVEAKDPSAVRFMEPPIHGYSVQERAAIQLSRRLLTAGTSTSNWSRYSISELFVEFLLKGSPLLEAPPAPVATVKKNA